MKENNSHQVLLIAVSAIAILAAAFLIWRTFAFPSVFEVSVPTKKAELPEVPSSELLDAKKHLSANIQWKSKPVIDQEGKSLTLFQSVPLLKFAGDTRIIDPYEEIDGILPGREPITNRYFLAHKLDYLRNDITKLDSDGDGFRNEEEFSWGETDPNDKSSHPPFWRKIYWEKIEITNYFLVYEGKSGTIFTVKRPQDRSPFPRRTIYPSLGKPFNATGGDDATRFTLAEYDESSDSILIEDAQTRGPDDGKYRLPLNQEVNFPFKDVFLIYDINGKEPSKNPVREGDEFEIPDLPGVKFKLIEVSEDGAKVTFTETQGENPKAVNLAKWPPKLP